MAHRSLRIGLAGPSCSGKSTAARIVAKRLGARLLSLDDFYVRGHERRFVDVDGERIRSFEHPDAYDGTALLREVEATEGPVVAEGFLLFAYPSLREAFSTKAYIDLSWDEIRRRRAGRTGQNVAAVNRSFDRIGSSEWALFGEPQGAVPGVVRIAGTLAPDEVADAVLALAAA